jgi:hypothetical protein
MNVGAKLKQKFSEGSRQDMARYNGHESWNAWNVSLWINNEEGLYRLALECVRATNTRKEAAERFVETINSNEWGCMYTTPDGAKYTKRSVQLAMRGMER